MPIRYDIDGTTYYHYLYTSKAGWVSECATNPFLKVVKGGTTYYAPLTQTAPTAGSILRIPFKISIGGTNYYPLACAVKDEIDLSYTTSGTRDIVYPSSAFPEEQTMEYSSRGGQSGGGKGAGGGGGAHRSRSVLGFHATVAASGGGGGAGGHIGAAPAEPSDTYTDNLLPGTTYQIIVAGVGSGGTAGGGAGYGANDSRAAGGTTTAGNGGASGGGGTGPATYFKIKNGATLYSTSGSGYNAYSVHQGYGAGPAQAGAANCYAHGGDGGLGGPTPQGSIPSAGNGSSDDFYNRTVYGGAGQDYNSHGGGKGGHGGTAKTDSAGWGTDGYGHSGASGKNGSDGTIAGYAYIKINYWVKGV